MRMALSLVVLVGWCTLSSWAIRLAVLCCSLLSLDVVVGPQTWRKAGSELP